MKSPQDPNNQKNKPHNGPRRTYQGADAVMLTAALVILDTAAEAAIQPQLQNRRSKLTPAALVTLRKAVTDAIKDDLGLNPTTIVQQLTQGVYSSQDLAKTALSQFNVDLKNAFASQRKAPRLAELRALLGLRDHYDAVIKDDQQALTELLAKFTLATNDAALRTELEDDLDISAAVIDAVRARANFAELDAAQEKGKGQARTITAETITKFNGIYTDVQTVATLGRSVYKEQPVTADRFSFSAVRRKMTGGTPSA